MPKQNFEHPRLIVAEKKNETEWFALDTERNKHTDSWTHKARVNSMPPILRNEGKILLDI